MSEEHTIDELDSDPYISGAAQCFYQAERVSTLGAKYPDKSQHELITLAVKEWNLELNIHKKVKYLRTVERMGLARQLKIRGYHGQANNPPAQRSRATASSFVNSNISLADLLKREPKKPPKNGYSLFTSEQLAKYVNVEPQKRMSEVARIWSQVISKEEKASFDARNKEMLLKYQTELNAFIESLTPEEKQVYEEYRNMKTKSKKKVKKF
ncbi:nucleolar transcription factor 1 [Tetranychus urticae]|uniref:HMG box domain-containing protein n=1 Tax=Tetranychus urticae TaxID=32264 RepID=T1KH55_TETUR|nr:nucleolar transcription factor 1 [Tetranychus urticae]